MQPEQPRTHREPSDRMAIAIVVIVMASLLIMCGIMAYVFVEVF